MKTMTFLKFLFAAIRAVRRELLLRKSEASIYRRQENDFPFLSRRDSTTIARQ